MNGARPNPAVILVVGVVIAALVSGFGTYYVVNGKATADKTALQTTISLLKAQETTLNKEIATLSKTQTTITPSELSSSMKMFVGDAQSGSLNFQYPSDFVVSENSNGFVSIADSSKESVADLTAVSGSVSSNVDFISQSANHWFEAKPVVESLQTASGLSCMRLTGTFSSNVGSFNSTPSGSHSGATGTSYVCQGTQGTPVIVFDSYDNGSASLAQTNAAIVATIR